jgi:hypothetical protein
VSGGHYVHGEVTVFTKGDEEVAALTYLAGRDIVVGDGKPSAEYLSHILAGATEHGLPADYTEYFKKLGG